VTFKGRQNEIEKYCKQAHLFVLPSLYKGFGNLYLEAINCSLPCITISPNNGKFILAFGDLLEHSTGGFLINEDNANVVV